MESNKQETQGNAQAGSSQQGDRVENDFPVGYRFVPKDFELVSYYLKRKIMNEPIPVGRIFDVELYKHNPDDLAGMHSQPGETDWYFFTPRDRKYPNGSRPNRAAGNGYWKATGCDKPIVNLQNETVGYRKTLAFLQGKSPNGDKTDWIMHEFRVDQPAGQSSRNKRSANDMRLDDWVLCRIHKKADGKRQSQNNEFDPADSPSEVVSGENTPAEDTEHRNLEVIAQGNDVTLDHFNEGGLLLVGNGTGNVPEQVYQSHVLPLPGYPAKDTEHRNLEVIAQGNDVTLDHFNEGGLLLVGNGTGNVPEQVYQSHVLPLPGYPAKDTEHRNLEVIAQGNDVPLDHFNEGGLLLVGNGTGNGPEQVYQSHVLPLPGYPAEDTEHRNLEVIAQGNDVPLDHFNEGGLLLVGNGTGNVPEQVYQSHVLPLPGYPAEDTEHRNLEVIAQGNDVSLDHSNGGGLLLVGNGAGNVPEQIYQSHVHPLPGYRSMAEQYSFASCCPQSSISGQPGTYLDYQLQSSFDHHGYYPMNNNVYDESSNLYYNNPEVDFGHLQVPLGNSYSGLIDDTESTDQFIDSILNFGTDVQPEIPSKRQNV